MNAYLNACSALNAAYAELDNLDVRKDMVLSAADYMFRTDDAETPYALTAEESAAAIRIANLKVDKWMASE